MKIEKMEELIALQKAMMFIKFTAQDSESRYIAASPIVGSLLKKIRVALEPFFEDRGLNYTPIYGNIEEHPECVEAVRRHVHNIPNWKEYKSDMQKDIIITLCDPFDVKDDTISNFMIEGSFE